MSQQLAVALRGASIAALLIAAGCSGGNGASPTTAVTSSDRAAPETTSPTETTAADTVATTPEDSAPESTVASDPPMDASLLGLLPDVAGFELRPPSRYWSTFLELPEDVDVAARDVVSEGRRIGAVIVAEWSSSEPLIDEYVETMFRAAIQLPTSSTPTDESGLTVVTNGAVAEWRAIESTAVVTVLLPDDGVGRWAWSHDDVLWIVDGSTEAIAFVEALITQQQFNAPADTFDFQGLYGGYLADRLPIVPPYLYFDLPRIEMLANLEQSIAKQCARHYYYGYVPASDDPDPERLAEGDLMITVAAIGGVCLENGFLDDLLTSLPTRPGLEQAVIGGAEVLRSANEIIYVVDDLLYVLASSDPATFDRMEPFVTQFFTEIATSTGTAVTTAVPPTTAAPTGTTLPPGAREMFTFEEQQVGMCIYRAPALPGQADLDRRFFEVDCNQPHQVELYHRFDVEGAPGTPFPGDGTVQAQVEPVCALTFAAYVGVPYETSRLEITYFYPSAETWAQGDRAVFCYLVGAVEDELFTRPMAGSGE